MGSFEHHKKQRRERPPGKIDSPLNEKLKNVKWGEFRVVDIFDVKNTHNILSTEVVADSGNTPYLCASAVNNGVSSYISYKTDLIEKGNCIFIGGKTFVVSYQKDDFYSNDSHNLALYLKTEKRSKSIQIFLASCIYQNLHNKYSWGNSISWKKIQDDIILLPLKENALAFSNPCDNIKNIDFDFMESFIRELEEERIRELNAYLLATGLKDYTLSPEEENALEAFKTVQWGEFEFKQIFNNIKQGRRLKKEDQKEGTIPFVMSGTTNTGVVGYISNPVASFPSNSITVDIFGNTFYRNFDFGAGDDTGVYWNDKENYSKDEMLFFTAAMGKSLFGKFDYGNKLRSSQSFDIKMQLPTKNNKPDYATMETFIKAVEKLVIKDVVLYADSKIKATENVVKRDLEYKINEDAGLLNVADSIN